MIQANALLEAFAQAGKRTWVVGDLSAGVIVALDMEGRLFTVWKNQVLNRVNLEAVAGQSDEAVYLNPGGDGLWPAPEGTSLGYQYAAGNWRVPPALRAVRYLVRQHDANTATIAGEVDLINNQGQGLPTIFGRQIAVNPMPDGLTVVVRESIRYTGLQTFSRGEVLLAPWTLCQFDSGPGCTVVFPCRDPAAIEDLYQEDSSSQRRWVSDRCYAATDGGMRYQVGLNRQVPWIEYQDPRNGLRVRRVTDELPAGQSFIDIRDADPATPPVTNGARYSIYNDPSGFMEMEAAGGCPAILAPGTEMSVAVSTRYNIQSPIH